MSLLLLLTLAATPQVELIGYNLYQFGVCEEAGWALDRQAVVQSVEAGLTTSGLSQGEFSIALEHGAARATAEFGAMTAAVATQADARAFGDQVIQQCDALATSHPDLLQRTASTGPAWEARMQGVIARYPR